MIFQIHKIEFVEIELKSNWKWLNQSQISQW